MQQRQVNRTMAPPSTATTNPSKSVSPQQALLDSLVGIVTKHVNEHLMGVAHRVVAALLDATDPSCDPRAMYLRTKSGNLLKDNSYAFFHVACIGLEQAVRKELAALAPAVAKASAAPVALSLVPLEEMDDKVAFEGVTRPFDITHSEALATLNVRLGVLLHREILRMNQNPFRPEVFLLALQQAWREFEPETQAHDLIAPLLKPEVLFDFAPMYEALNQALMHKGVLPGSLDAHRLRKTDNAAAAKAARASSKAALSKQLRQFFADSDEAKSEFDDEIPMIPDLPAMPKGNGGWRPSGAQAFQGALAHPEPAMAAAAPAHPGAYSQTAQQPGGSGAANGALLDFLGQLQKRLPGLSQGPHAGADAGSQGAPAGTGLAPNVFYLPKLKESLPKGSMSRGDESTIDLLARIFDTVFLDDSIPAEIRELIQFLQIPVLKAALVDKNFFFQEAHPARRMIDLVSRMGWEQRKGADDPLFQAMQRSVHRVGREDSHEQGVFAEAVAELEASIEAEEVASASAIAGPIAKAMKQEKVTAATRSAKNAVAMRLGSGELVAIVETFLENKWTSVMTVAYSVEEEKPGAVGNATKTMDELIWSVKPKITHEQRKDLIGKLPGLLQTLNKWLDVIKWQDAERLQFFADLAKCHAAIVRAPIDLSPARQLEIAVEAAQQDAIRRIEKENALAASEEEAQADEAVITVDGLERGMWLEFIQSDASVRKVKLAWVSPLRTLFIFSTGARQEAFSVSSEKLAEAYRQQKVHVIGSDGVVARALSHAMDQAAVNDPSIHGAASAA
jgi:hypothetical protein